MATDLWVKSWVPRAQRRISASARMLDRPRLVAPSWVPVSALALFALATKIAGGGHGIPDVALDALTGGSYLACGLALRTRRSMPAMATLLILASAAWFAEDLDTSHVAVIFTTGAVLQNAFDPFLVLLVLSFPVGRLGDRAARVLVACAFASSIGLAALSVGIDPPLSGSGTQAIGLSFVHVGGAAETIRRLQDVIDLVLTPLVLIVFIRRLWLAASGSPIRAMLTRAAVAGGLVFVVLCVHDALTVGHHLHSTVNDSFGVLQSLTVIAFPICIALGMLQADATRMRVAELLPARLATAELQTILRSLLADPLLEIRAGSSPAPTPGHPSTPLLSQGRYVGVLIHGSALTDEVELLRLVTAAAADSLTSRRHDPGARDAVQRLSVRQREVLALLADGYSNDSIAQRLGIGTKTVEKHVHNIYEILELPPELRLNRRVGATVAWLEADVDPLGR